MQWGWQNNPFKLSLKAVWFSPTAFCFMKLSPTPHLMQEYNYLLCTKFQAHDLATI
jgi:hypothetical protein